MHSGQACRRTRLRRRFFAICRLRPLGAELPSGPYLQCIRLQIRELSAARLPIGHALSIWAPIGQPMLICLTCFPDQVPVMLKFNPIQGHEKLT